MRRARGDPLIGIASSVLALTGGSDAGGASTAGSASHKYSATTLGRSFRPSRRRSAARLIKLPRRRHRQHALRRRDRTTPSAGPTSATRRAGSSRDSGQRPRHRGHAAAPPPERLTGTSCWH